MWLSAGPFSLSLSTYHCLLKELCGSILRAGFKKILIVNSHGGNVAALNAMTTGSCARTQCADCYHNAVQSAA